MSKVAMLEPYVFIDPFEWKIAAEGEGGIPCITTTQAEAYADARAREVQQWISVDDRLPETNRGISGWARALAYWTTSDPDYEPGGIETSFFDGRNWQGANGDMDYHGARRVTHWMPLPAPPQQ